MVRKNKTTDVGLETDLNNSPAINQPNHPNEFQPQLPNHPANFSASILRKRVHKNEKELATKN